MNIADDLWLRISSKEYEHNKQKQQQTCPALFRALSVSETGIFDIVKSMLLDNSRPGYEEFFSM